MNEKPKYNVWQCVSFMVRRAWQFQKSIVLFCVALALLVTAQSLLQLFVAPQILQRIEEAAPIPQLLGTIAAFTLGLWAVAWLVAYVRGLKDITTSEIGLNLLVEANRKNATISYPHKLDPTVLNLEKAAGVATWADEPAAKLIWDKLTDMLANVLGFVLYLLVLKDMDPVLLAVAAATTMASFFFTRKCNARADVYFKEKDVYWERIYYFRKKAESATLAKDVRIFGLKDWILSIYDKALKMLFMASQKETRQFFLIDVADLILAFARNGVAYFYLIRMALAGVLTASQFLLFFTAVSGFTAWVMGILRCYTDLRKDCRPISSMYEYLNYPEAFRFEDGDPIPLAEGYELRLEHVSYRYPGADADTIHGVDLTIRPGEKVAIVGLNGAGKTTLVRLLCGFLDPTEGRVLLNGADIRQFDRREYYKLFSAVFQEYFAQDITVAETVAQTIEHMDRERVTECLKMAGMLDAVLALPKGLDSHIGKEIFYDGVQLSGGQMQRLMLARALYKDGPILALDEPTAALDPLAENDIYMKYNEMTAGKTALFISHRLASTRFCDRILFLEDGMIAEEGTHDTLVRAGGRYAALFEVQSRYYREGREF